MTLFELTLRVDHVDPAIVDDLIDRYDATAGRDHSGQEYVTLLAEGADFQSATRSVVGALQVKGVCVRRVVPDLLTKADIARRLGVSRQAVQLWVAGQRSEGFPPAINPVNGGVWLWHDVHQWAVAQGRMAPDEIEYPTSTQLDHANADLDRVATGRWGERNSSQFDVQLNKPRMQARSFRDLGNYRARTKITQ